MQKKALDTHVVHTNQRKNRLQETPTVSPVQFSNTYTLESPSEMDEILGGERTGFTYGRHGNPTVSELEVVLAGMEQGESAKVYASGMAALQGALLACDLSSGHVVLASRDLYGATVTLMKDIFGSFGIEIVSVNMSDTNEAVRWLKNSRVKAVVLESISNPLLRVVDMPALLKAANQHGVKSIVDNTFATPYLCNPLNLGATMVVHSLTKYLNGHGDSMSGAVVTSEINKAKLTSQQKLTGSVLGPMEAWLTLRGLKTFVVRFERQLQSAKILAVRLSQHARIKRVYHPGLTTHPDYEQALKLFPKGQGAVLSFEIDGGKDSVFLLMQNLQVVVPATTVGDVYSLLLYPVMASHRSLTDEERRSSGITEGLVRLSVGIEHVDDIWNDLNQALNRV
ncbi:PLP-dependent aspartate aminotransferase family protein [Alicyclobacillus sp. SO9]|uniref:trans-sulfuration enzyme family protein n=1 Tax=Alicyclobacillus sp. SO9 TaxID=2665646 RepID=UPI0018E7DA63|nr:PLP-dependent aspartate aminotransferase family protein [Alicyclobacillus sp. SO9]QQE79869.1 PLP-dependent transferase [Alicyclobacillus sp. SO9]